MAGYDAARGFGAGPADVIALDAVTAALSSVPGEVRLHLAVDGVEVAAATIDPSQPYVPAILDTVPASASVELTLRAEPEGGAGMGGVATLRSGVPWDDSGSLRGVDVDVDLGPQRVGRAGVLTVRTAAPSGTDLVIEQGLPAGTEVDELALAGAPGLAAVHVSTDRVRLVTEPMSAGGIFEVEIPVRPAFAGDFGTRPLEVAYALRISGAGTP